MRFCTPVGADFREWSAEWNDQVLKTVVCDDEAPALELLSSLLEETGEVEIVMACQSVREALRVINNGGIDLAVFDVEMPELSGVEAFGQVTIEPRPLVVFATAHPEYAVEAFGVDAIDYIMKPLDCDRVSRAIEKAVRLNRLVVERQRGKPPAASDEPPSDPDGVLKIKDAGQFYFIPHAEIIWIEAAGDYSIVHMPDREVTIRVAVKTLEAELPQTLFARVHRSAIVSIPEIRQVSFLAKGEALIRLSNDALVRTSRSYRDIVQNLGAAT